MTDDLKKRLSPLAYDVTQKGGTEYGGTGKFYKHAEDGTYVCIVCEAPLFESEHKFQSDCGWPAFQNAIEGAIRELEDRSHGMIRIETRCAKCDAHLGHKFDDGPRDAGGVRYCINSVALQFGDEQG
jgi:peptide-methionine (R)-S-oxide reductase